MKIAIVAVCGAIGFVGSQAALAQAARPQQPALVSIVGEPFSGVRTWQGSRSFIGGNRIDRGTSERLYRDGQGRTRVEREIPAQVLANNPHMEPVQITINDPLSGDRIELQARSKTALVFHGGSTPAVAPLKSQPPVSVTFAGHLYTGADQGWSKPASLGEKSFDGVRATGQRRQYTVPVGTIGNEKPIVLTVDQWFSPELSLIVARTGTSSIAGEFGMQVENIVHGEPDAALFLIPADYTRVEMPARQAKAR
jgi:hypothetical protein